MSHLTEEQVNLFVDKELLPSEMEEIKLHLKGCEQCRTQVKSLEMLGSFLREIPLETVSANFSERVMSVISQQRSLFSLVWKPLAVFFAIFLVNAIIVLQSSPTAEAANSTQSRHLIDIVKNYVSTGVHIFSGFSSRYLSFLGGNSLNVFILIALLIVGLLFDKFFLNVSIRRKA